MTIATKEKTWAEIAYETLPEIIQNTSIPKLIENGIDANFTFSCLAVEDAGFEKVKEKHRESREKIRKLTADLPEAVRNDIEAYLEEMDTEAYMMSHWAAEKMADLLIRFYLRSQWGLKV